MHADSALPAATDKPLLDQPALAKWLKDHGWDEDASGRWCSTRPGLAYQRARPQQYRVVFAPAGVRVEAKEPDCKGVRLPWFRVSYGVWGKTVYAEPGAVSVGGARITPPPRAA